MEKERKVDYEKEDRSLFGINSGAVMYSLR